MRPARACAAVALGVLLLAEVSPAAARHRRRHRHRPRHRRAHILPLSIQIQSRTDLFSQPGKQGHYVGTLARGTRVPILREAPGRRCKGHRWLQVTTEGWVCASHGRLSWRFPSAVPQPVLPAGRLVPRRVYYTHRDGVPIYVSKEDAAAGKQDRVVERGFSFSVRYGLRIGHKYFMKTRRGEIIPRKDLWKYRPSSFQGRPLNGRPPQGIGCAIGYKHTTVRDGPSRRARRVDRLPHHTWVKIYEARGRGRKRFLRIEQNRWVRAEDVRQIHFTDPPPGIGPHDHWVEVLLRYQTLVAYEGRRPVRATLVSTGRWDHKTPSGLFRANTKVALSTMTNREGDGELYRVDDVPWILYFHEGFALHGTYWHDSFGVVKSHGCVNLAPRDARWIFDWASPKLRPGWAAVQSSATHPGLLIRIRNSPRSRVPYRGPADQRPKDPSLARR